MGQDHLAAQIQQQLDTSKEIHAVVAEQEGKILLSGTANTRQARLRATEIASSMAPHRQIINNLEVEHDLPLTSEGNTSLTTEDEQSDNEALAEAIRRELREDTATTDLNIQVEVDQGIVYLQGTVSNLEDAENAEEVARCVPGVVEIVDDLDIVEM